jgi:hypothetical protein
MLRALSDAKADYLVIGALAVAAHGYVRATKDMDLWIRSTPENIPRVWSALVDFGAPLEQLTPEDLLVPGTIFQIGIDPIRIDILTRVAGLDFEGAWSRRTSFDDEGAAIPCLSREDLLASKLAAGRPNDLRDIEELGRLPQ